MAWVKLLEIPIDQYRLRILSGLFEDRIKLNDLTIVSGNKVMPTASVKIVIDGEEILIFNL